MSGAGPAADGQGSAVTVAVMGSCITRDNFNTRFNPDYKRFYSCPLLQNQTSLISLMSPPIDAEVVPVGAMSDYDRWNIRTELSRSFLSDLVALAPEYLILDFFGDVHFGCLELDDGRVVTNNHWKLWRTTWYRDRSSVGELRAFRLEDDEDAYVERWTAALDRFLALVREQVPTATVVVHRGHYAARTVRADGVSEVSLNRGRASKVDVARKNALWRRLDDIAVERAEAPQIDLTRGEYTSYDEHPWGPFFVHYTPEYYHRFLACLHSLHLARAGDPGVAAMVADIDRAWTAHADRLTTSVERERARVGRLRRRVRRAEAAARPAERGWRRARTQVRSLLGRRPR